MLIELDRGGYLLQTKIESFYLLLLFGNPLVLRRELGPWVSTL